VGESGLGRGGLGDAGRGLAMVEGAEVPHDMRITFGEQAAGAGERQSEDKGDF
jgi:hypothetical protein